MSVFMIIAIQGNLPYLEKSDNITETIYEVVILIACYHMFLISDFVPSDNYEFREIVGISLVSFVSVVCATFIILIAAKVCK